MRGAGSGACRFRVAPGPSGGHVPAGPALRPGCRMAANRPRLPAAAVSPAGQREKSLHLRPWRSGPEVRQDSVTRRRLPRAGAQGPKSSRRALVKRRYSDYPDWRSMSARHPFARAKGPNRGRDTKPRSGTARGNEEARPMKPHLRFPRACGDPGFAGLDPRGRLPATASGGAAPPPGSPPSRGKRLGIPAGVYPPTAIGGGEGRKDAQKIGRNP